jgi:chaperonin cofactor prefoldin
VITKGLKDRLEDLELKWKDQQKQLEPIRASIDEYNAMYRKSGLPAIRYK